MPRKPTRQGTGVTSERAEPGTEDQAVEHAIDAVDWLRSQMRRMGMTACADALDEAFVKCLQDYLEHRRQSVQGGPTVKKMN